MDIYFATTNKGKVQSLQRDLGQYDIAVIQVPIELIEPRSHDIQEIAGSKIAQAYAQIGRPTVVIDAGFYVDELNGFPRTFVNFALETIGLEGLLKLVEEKERGCEFRSCLAYMDQHLERPKYFTTHTRGMLAPSVQGAMQKHLWSELGRIFIPEGCDKTLAAMSYDDFLVWREQSRKEDSVGKQLYGWLSQRE